MTDRGTRPFVSIGQIDAPVYAQIDLGQSKLQLNAEYVWHGEKIDCVFELCAERNEVDIVIDIKTHSGIAIPLDGVRFLLKRATPNGTALEIVTAHQVSHLVMFKQASVDGALRRLPGRLFDVVPYLARKRAKWVSGNLCTFRYLCALNAFGDRSVHLPEIYPAFPLPYRSGRIVSFRSEPPAAIDAVHGQPISLVELARIRALLDGRLEEFQDVSSDFFTCPEVFHGLGLPAGCANEFEYVYMLRAFLECPAFVESVHLWIRKLTGAPHEPRGRPAPLHVETFEMELPAFLHCSFANDAFLLVNPERAIVSQTFGTVKHPLQHWASAAPAGSFIPANGAIIILSPGRHVLNLWSPDGAQFERRKFPVAIQSVTAFSRIIAVCTDASDIIFLGRLDATFRLTPGYSLDSILELHCESASCFFLHWGTRRVIIGTTFGQLRFYSADTRSFIRGVSLDSRFPRRVLVTSGFNFVVVHCDRYLAVFTINGSKICERELDSDIVTWEPFMNRDGFDFLAVADLNRAIFCVEVFTLKFVKLAEVESDVALLHFQRSHDRLVYATTRGQSGVLDCCAEHTVFPLVTGAT
jgi:hypothetical protein